MVKSSDSDLKTIITNNLAYQNYIVPEIFYEAEQKDHESLNIINYQLNDAALTYQLELKFPKIKKVNAMENQITSFHLLCQLFPQVETLVLSNSSLMQPTTSSSKSKNKTPPNSRTTSRNSTSRRTASSPSRWAASPTSST